LKTNEEEEEEEEEEEAEAGFSFRIQKDFSGSNLKSKAAATLQKL
jgi:hypothetical protein